MYKQCCGWCTTQFLLSKATFKQYFLLLKSSSMKLGPVGLQLVTQNWLLGSRLSLHESRIGLHWTSVELPRNLPLQLSTMWGVLMKYDHSNKAISLLPGGRWGGAGLLLIGCKLMTECNKPLLSHWHHLGLVPCLVNAMNCFLSHTGCTCTIPIVTSCSNLSLNS